MGGISINSNLSALQAQRQLGAVSDQQSRIFERLSSGQRINRASDDAAGLAIASSLNSSGRVYGQALRNANDGISALNIAEGGLSELSGITMRLSELATQAANGSFSRFQRLSIQNESDKLTDEFNRLIQTSSFNGQNLLDLSNSNLSLQLGYGNSERLGVTVGGQLQRTIGSSVGGRVSSGALGGGAYSDVEIADVNGDGTMDMIAARVSTLRVALGNGDGSFKAVQSYAMGQNAVQMAIGDVDGNGSLDIVLTGSGTANLKVMLNNGSGAFNTSTTVAGSSNQSQVALKDLNGDGKLDIAYARTLSNLGILLGNGDGTFQAETSLTTVSSTYGVNVADFNGDGKMDLLSGNQVAGNLSLFLGNGDGTFGAASTIASGIASPYNAIGDFNRDGIIDIATSPSSGSARIILGNGDGTFKTPQALTVAADTGVLTTDLNQDGYLDLVFGDSNNSYLYAFGNGDGTFKTAAAVSGGNGSFGQMAAGDLNGDGLPDLIDTTSALGQTDIAYGQGSAGTTIQRLNMATREGALSALDTIQSIFNRVTSELGVVGAAQSRIQSAARTLKATQENYKAAEGRIVDADIASDSANLVRTNILKESAAAVLSQANQQPALALQLLRG